LLWSRCLATPFEFGETEGSMDIATLAGILGHRDTATTLRHYARWVPSANAAAMERMDDVL
jgi:integrase